MAPFPENNADFRTIFRNKPLYLSLKPLPVRRDGRSRQEAFDDDGPNQNAVLMNIVLYGVPAETARQIARKYDLNLVNTPDKFNPAGSLVVVPPMTVPHHLLPDRNNA